MKNIPSFCLLATLALAACTASEDNTKDSATEETGRADGTGTLELTPAEAGEMAQDVAPPDERVPLDLTADELEQRQPPEDVADSEKEDHAGPLDGMDAQPPDGLETQDGKPEELPPPKACETEADCQDGEAPAECMVPACVEKECTVKPALSGFLCHVGDACLEGECDGAGTCISYPPLSCQVKECGDDGCGGSCGDCPAGFLCHPAKGICLCDKQCKGKQCGDDGCGGSCGTCPENGVCTDKGLCKCQPDCTGKTCGGDGCGGSCGSCPAGKTCIGGTECVNVSCEDKECGDDGFGGTCGFCPEGKLCGGDYKCVCPGTCQGKECGEDGCGNVCGPACPEGQYCKLNQCLKLETVGSCQDKCNEMSEQCWCDKFCHGNGDCCDDVCDVCPALPFCCAENCPLDGTCGQDNGCGAPCECPPPWECTGEGFCCFPHCDGLTCGGDDGCGFPCDCPPGSKCEDGVCVCVPDCDVWDECGDDGCGGSCGECLPGQTCESWGACTQDWDKLCQPHECGDWGGGCSCTLDCVLNNNCCPNICEACPVAQGCCPPANCEGKLCTDDDGCGGQCGCDYGFMCKPDGTCCQQTCGAGAKTCDDDGCGGKCGCPAPKVCAYGFCFKPTTGSCAGCPFKSSDCYCDDACFSMGDCCLDICDQCPAMPKCPQEQNQ
jgi:hypothetical protein